MALDANEWGHLRSIDYPVRAGDDLAAFRDETFEDAGAPIIPPGADPGWLIPDDLRDRWVLAIGKSQRQLPQMLPRGAGMDLFVHDSEHSHPCMMMEYELAHEWLRPGGVIISDDIRWNDAFDIFCDVRDVEAGQLSRDVGYLRKPVEEVRTDGGLTVDDLDECWCCGGLHDAFGSLCPACSDAGCDRFSDVCDADHKPVMPDGGRDVGDADRYFHEEDRETFRRAIETWGLDAQVDMAVEECAELIVALQHLQRDRATWGEVIRELADVRIMCEQLRCYLGQDFVDRVVQEKMGRLEERLEPDDDPPARVEDCETIDDCELPTGIYERHDDGEEVVCPKCGRVWEHNDGYFTQTGRRLNTVEDPDDDRRTDGGRDEGGLVGDTCRLPGCDEPQEFPNGVDALCLHHSLCMYFYWRPLAEFGRYVDPGTDGGRDVGGSSGGAELPASVQKRPEKERKVWVEMYPGGDTIIELGHIDNVEELYLQSGEAEALYEALDELVNRTVDPDSDRNPDDAVRTDGGRDAEEHFLEEWEPLADLFYLSLLWVVPWGVIIIDLESRGFDRLAIPFRFLAVAPLLPVFPLAFGRSTGHLLVELWFSRWEDSVFGRPPTKWDDRSVVYEDLEEVREDV